MEMTRDERFSEESAVIYNLRNPLRDWLYTDLVYQYPSSKLPVDSIFKIRLFGFMFASLNAKAYDTNFIGRAQIPFHDHFRKEEYSNAVEPVEVEDAGVL
jgi:hypothetical protein